MELTFYGYRKCGTCRNAEKWLLAHGHQVRWVEIIEHPPTAEELGRFLDQSGLDIQKLFNVSGEAYREQKLKDKLPGMTKVEKLQLLASNGKLIKRPIVTDGSRVTVGFQEQHFQDVWGNAQA